MKLFIDQKKCLSCGACLSFAPLSFKIDENNSQIPCQPINPPQDNQEDIKAAIDVCPTQAIKCTTK